jgi:hypothetical protein
MPNKYEQYNRQRAERGQPPISFDEFMKLVEEEFDRAPNLVRVLNPDGSQVYRDGYPVFRKVRAN